MLGFHIYVNLLQGKGHDEPGTSPLTIGIQFDREYRSKGLTGSYRCISWKAHKLYFVYELLRGPLVLSHFVWQLQFLILLLLVRFCCVRWS